MAKTIEQLDATAREICRLFQEGRFDTVLNLLDKLIKREVAFVIAFAMERLAPTTRVDFVKFFERQANAQDSSQ